MACILVDGVVQGTFTIKDLEKSKTNEEKAKRTIAEHWKYEIANYKRLREPNTIKQYENFYKRYIEPYLGNKKPSEIKTKDIDKILMETNLKDAAAGENFELTDNTGKVYKVNNTACSIHTILKKSQF